MVFAEKLQTLRKGKGLSQEALAEAVGVSRQAVSKWESGQAYPEIDKLVSISNLFSVSIDSLVKDEAEQPNEPETEKSSPIFYHRAYYDYEFKSKRTVMGLPLVHINIGHGLRVARGIIAIGNIAVGVISLGALALGVLSFGALAVGVAAFAGLAIGGLAAGGFAAGLLAFGGCAIGIVAVGGSAVGVYSIGGMAIASKIAVGGYARAPVAIGDTAIGIKTLVTHGHDFAGIHASQVRELILQTYPHIPDPLLSLFTAPFSPG